MSNAAQQMVSVTNDNGIVELYLGEDMPDFNWSRVDMAVANMNSPNGRADWCYVVNAESQHIRIKFSHTNNGESLPLRSTQVTYTLQVWGVFTWRDPEQNEVDPAVEEPVE